MDFQTQLAGINKFLTLAYGDETTLNAALAELGFTEVQVASLSESALENLAAQFLEVIHKRLTNDAGKDTYYQILARYYGLDGEPAEALSSLAPKYQYSPEFLRQTFEEIVQRVKTKTWQTELKKSLKQIAVQKLNELNQKPEREAIVEKLMRLENLKGAADVARLDYEAKRAELLKLIQPQLDALAVEYQPLLDSAEENIATLENEIKTEALVYGESVTGGAYRAVFTRGRVSWDNEGIEKYAVTHPEVMQFRKQGQPTVSLRVAEKK
ncbi:MAG: hypothetical protein IT310_09130 [Anaerolineales bacterium]|nr:hypothetical protein [Anaerolineales bacterium]